MSRDIKNRTERLKNTIIIAIVSIIFIMAIKVNINNEVISYIQELNHQVVQRIDTTIKNSFDNLDYIEEYINEVRENYGDEYDENKTLMAINSRVAGNMFNSVGIADINGVINFGTKSVNIEDREYFKEAIQGKKYISKIIKGRHNEKELVGYAKPLKDKNGNVNSLLVAYSDYKDIIEMLNITLYNGKIKSYILNADGDIIVGSKEDYVEHREKFNIMIDETTTDLYEEGVYKSKYSYISCSKSNENNQWFAVSEIPINVVFKNLNNILYISVVIIILYILFYICNDIRKSKINNENYINAKFIDGLTDIENKECFRLKINEIILANKNKKYLLLNFDIVSFKFINEIFGYEKGNKILQKIASNMNDIQNKVAIGRIENDVFGVMIEYIDDMDMSKVVENIKACIKKNNILEESSHSIEFNVGITKIKFSDSIDKKMDEMDLARVECKKHNELTYYFYDGKLEKRKREMLIIENELLSGLNNNEFKILYQPKIDCITKRIVGVEALIRWISKEYGFISPATFISVAERNGNINNIGKWVLEEVCKVIKKSTDENEIIVPISVNVSRVELYRCDFIEMTKKIIKKYNVDTKLLEFEITETTALNDTKYINEQIQKIKELGIKVSMDDFGTGTSTLSNLKCIDIDILKIDRSMLLDIEKDKKTKALIKNIINIAKEFGFAVVCEGIETMEQVEVLEKIDCDVIQGYVFSKPIEWNEVKNTWLTK